MTTKGPYNPNMKLEQGRQHKPRYEVIDAFDKLKPADPDVNERISEVITELRANPRVRDDEHPTKYEQMLEIILTQPHDFAIKDLAPVFANTANPEHSARRRLFELNEKLERHGLALARRVRGSRYFLFFDE